MGWESAPPPWLPKAKQGNAFSDHKRHRLILVQEVGCCLAVQPQRLSKLPPYIARVLVLFMVTSSIWLDSNACRRQDSHESGILAF